MTKKLILLIVCIFVLAGCSNTPEVINLQATVDSAVSTAMAPYEEQLANMVSVEMLATSQYEQNQTISDHISDQIGWYLEENAVTSETQAVDQSSSVDIVEIAGQRATATPPVYSYDNTNCVDRFTYVSDLTIADGMTITPNTVFEKKWYITNSGTCTWNSGYKVTYMTGDTVSSAKSFPILQPGYFVRPGESTVVTATLTAPANVGNSFTTYWAIESDKGEQFGSGEAKNVYLSSNFKVTNSFDAVQNFGSLICADDYGYITCGSRAGNGRGIVFYDDTPLLESSRSHGIQAIAVQPPDGENTSVRFEFGPLRFPRKSTFYTNFCCRPNTPTCDVTIRLYVRELGYANDRLILEAREWNDGLTGEWKYVLDDIYIFDQDFTYIIEVQANGGADADDLILFTNTKIY